MPEINFNRPLLAIDSGTSMLSIALRTENNVDTFSQDVGAKQSDILLPALNQLLKNNSLKINDLSAILYNRGPGMFTGLRVGFAVAQGLALPHNIPLIGIPYLDAVASLMPNCDCVLAAVDARMGEYFYAFFDTCRGIQLTDYAVNSADNIKLPAEFSPHQIHAIGNAFGIENTIANIAGINKMPCAANFFALAPHYMNEDTSLLYVRNKIALTTTEQAMQK